MRLPDVPYFTTKSALTGEIEETPDLSALRYDEAILRVAAAAKRAGKTPAKFCLPPEGYVWLELNLERQHEYIDEEISYLVLRVPERLLVYTSNRLEYGMGELECVYPSERIEVILAK